jgi:hypothetical protein
MNPSREAAKSRPAGDSPACRTTGWPCGLRGVENRPAMSNCAPRQAKSPTCASRRKRPAALSATTASDPQESHSARTASRVSPARS